MSPLGAPFPPWVGVRGWGGVGDAPRLCPGSWLEACLREELPPPTELEETLRNGVLLAKLGHRFAPAVVPLKKIYDREQARYKVRPRRRGFWGGGACVPPKLPGSFPSLVDAQRGGHADCDCHGGL